MLIQATAPRPIFDHSKHPQYLHIHTLRKFGVSRGEVFFIATVDPEHGTRGSKSLDPVNEYPIEGTDGFEALEYIVPFWELFKRTGSMAKTRYNGQSAMEQGIAVGSVKLARYCTNGFSVTIKSGFRSDRANYEEHTLALTILTPVTGGGILRLANCPYDIANPTFDPWAADPHPANNLELQAAFNRTHKLGNPSIEAKRLARIAEAENLMEERRIQDHESGWPDKHKRKLLPSGGKG
jgi:hypothetical protein